MDTEPNKNEKWLRLLRVGLLVAALLVISAFPVAAWLTSQKKVAGAAKINRPTTIEITAGQSESHQYININAIDVRNGRTDETEEGEDVVFMDFVFGVIATDPYFLQLAYTTNNPFTYKIFPATEHPGVRPEKVDGVDYTTHGTPRKNYYYTKDDQAFEGAFLNQKTDVAGPVPYEAETSGAYHDISYDGGETAFLVQTHAEPLYWRTNEQVVDVDNVSSDTTLYYILRVIWPKTYTVNTRETDILYISAYAGSLGTGSSGGS